MSLSYFFCFTFIHFLIQSHFSPMQNHFIFFPISLFSLLPSFLLYLNFVSTIQLFFILHLFLFLFLLNFLRFSTVLIIYFILCSLPPFLFSYYFFISYSLPFYLFVFFSLFISISLTYFFLFPIFSFLISFSFFLFYALIFSTFRFIFFLATPNFFLLVYFHSICNVQKLRWKCIIFEMNF